MILGIQIKRHPFRDLCVGLHLDWYSHQVWLYCWLFSIWVFQWLPYPRPNGVDCHSDVEEPRYNTKHWIVVHHIQPNDNTSFFNLGLRLNPFTVFLG